MKNKIKDTEKIRGIDKAGNALIIMKSGNVYLQLPSEGSRKRRLGFIDWGNKIFNTERERAKHFHRMSSTYGFNHYLFALLNPKQNLFERVRLTDETGEYLIPCTEILERQNRFLHFKNQGFELQIFYPESEINKFAIKQQIPVIE